MRELVMFAVAAGFVVPNLARAANCIEDPKRVAQVVASIQEAMAAADPNNLWEYPDPSEMREVILEDEGVCDPYLGS